MTTTLSIFAQALIDNRDYANKRINGEAVGVTNARLWANTIKACRLPAYAVRSARYNAMGDAEKATIDQTPLYDAIRPIIDLIGEVNGRKLKPENVAEEFIACSKTDKKVAISNEMAHADFEKSKAKKKFEEDPTEENLANFDYWKDEVSRLEDLPGNRKYIPIAAKEMAFIKAVERALGDAIKGETMKTAEQVAKEEADEKAAKKAKKQAKRQAAAIAKKAEAEKQA